jgi:hypothetical protein
MDASELTPEQARRILAAVEPVMGYTGRLTRRMQQVGWKPSDPPYVHALRAHDALHALRIIAHYNVCGLGDAGKQSPGAPGRPLEPLMGEEGEGLSWHGRAAVRPPAELAKRDQLWINQRAYAAARTGHAGPAGVAVRGRAARGELGAGRAG